MKFGLNSFCLKLIALVTMVIDHTGMVLFPECVGLRIIGRISFPIYAFLVAEGFYHTHNVKKYMMRLFLFALISEIPFDLVVTGTALEFRYQNIFFTMFIGVVLMYFYREQFTIGGKMLCVLLLTTAGDFLRTDYGSWGVLLIFCFYIFREKRREKNIAAACINIFAYGGIQSFAVMALLPINMYNGEKGPGLKYFFYIIYPAHLLILYLIRISI